jgi:hypothetical protein
VPAVHVCEGIPFHKPRPELGLRVTTGEGEEEGADQRALATIFRVLSCSLCWGMQPVLVQWALARFPRSKQSLAP